MMTLYECVPYDPVVRESKWYMNNWLYVYRYEKEDHASYIDRMMSKAKSMVDEGYIFNYVNPSFGWNDWCCVTLVSFWVAYASGINWKMGGANQPYLWSPKYGGEYDKFLLDAGFTKYDYNKVDLRNGDIIQSWGHVALVHIDEGGFDVSNMPELRRGSTGNVVKNLQVLLNYWMCQSGANEPLLVDGVFGAKTDERLKLYQKLQGLYVDGVCGPITWADILLA